MRGSRRLGDELRGQGRFKRDLGHQRQHEIAADSVGHMPRMPLTRNAPRRESVGHKSIDCAG